MKKIHAHSTRNKRLFACTLLFEFRKVTQRKKILCEERIFRFKASSLEDAYALCIEMGHREEQLLPMGKETWDYQFVGVLELVELSMGRSRDEIWHRFVERFNPLSRIPAKGCLTAFKSEKRFSK